MQHPRVLEVPEELVAHARPAAALHGFASCLAEGSPLARISGEVRDAHPQVAEIARSVQPAVDAHPHEVERTSTAGRDDGDAARVGLLQGLTEGLALPRVHEQVERRHRRGERLSAEVSEEEGIRQQALQPRTARSVAHDHESRAGHTVQRGEVLDLLLRCEPAHIADHDVGSPGGAQRTVAAGGLEALGIHSATPAAHTVDAERGQLLRRLGRGRERQRRPPVEPGDVRLSDPRGRRDAIALGVGRDVGLIGRDGCHVETFRREHAAPPEGERRGEMDDVRLEATQGGRDAVGRRGADPDVPVARQREARDRLDARTVHGLGDADGRGGDHVRIVPPALEVPQDLQHRSGHAVHVRKEGLRDDRYSHTLRMTATACGILRNRPSPPDVHRMLERRSPAIRSLVPVHPRRAQ